MNEKGRLLLRQVIVRSLGWMALLITGCELSSASDPEPPRFSPAEGAGQRGPSVPARPLEETLLEIARGYDSYARVDDETRWAPFLCRSPLPSQARFSQPAGAPHGQKLYSVYARFRGEYVKDGPPLQPVGQILVKESWIPEEVSGKDKEATLAHDSDSCDTRSWNPYARHEGRLYKATTKAGLFIMMKTGAADGETDQGWIYGTVSADGKIVTSQGRIPACMSCHRKASGDRLFGLPRPE